MTKLLYTPAQFASKNRLARSTVWRWLTQKNMIVRFKMYDASVKTIAGKKFIEQ